MRFKTLSFYDFDEDKRNLINNDKTDMGFDDSQCETLSDFQSVDEGAIAVLSMDEIRNMKNLEK